MYVNNLLEAVEVVMDGWHCSIDTIAHIAWW